MLSSEHLQLPRNQQDLEDPHGRTEREGNDLLWETKVNINFHSDVVLARGVARTIAQQIGFPLMTISLIVTAVSELAHNVTKYAQQGRMLFRETARDGKRGLLVHVSDQGPGIPDLDKAMQKGFSTSQGLGLGLPGCRRLMDEFEIHSQVGKGTVVRMVKWL
jgi:serine/threonine-protein kinase RsbT